MIRSDTPPKAGTYFRIENAIYKAIDSEGELVCEKCAFVVGKGMDKICSAPDKLNCRGLYFEDHTHVGRAPSESCERVQKKEQETAYWIGMAATTLIMIAVCMYLVIK